MFMLFLYLFTVKRIWQYVCYAICNFLESFLYRKYSRNLIFLRITHISQKYFQMMLAVNIGNVVSPHHALGHT